MLAALVPAMASSICCMWMSGVVLQILLLMRSVTVSAQIAKVDPYKGRPDPMKEMEEKAKEHQKHIMDKTGEHPMKKLGARPQVCSACKLTMTKFQSIVARQMKGKWDEGRKRQVFEKNLAKACIFPAQMVILDRGKGKVYADLQGMLTDGAPIGTTVQQNLDTVTKQIQRMDDGVKKEIVAACRHVLEVEFKQDLLNKFLVKSRPDGTDIDFTGFICGSKKMQVCDIEEDFPPEGESEEL